MNVRVMSLGSTYLSEVQALWRRHSATLGFLPAGAFEEAAARGWLLGAVDDSGGLAGYLLFRITNRRQAAIAHLCVSEAFRGRGIARALFARLLESISGCTDVIVTCRRDFDVHKLWPRLGFDWVGEKPAKREGAVLSTFRYGVAPLPLLARGESKPDASRVRLVLDANVFLDLDERSTEEPASRALEADWLSEFVDLCLTEETRYEIARNDDPVERERQQRRAALFTVLPTLAADEQRVLAEVRSLLATGDSPSEQSDARQVAKAIATRSSFFVTRDQDILDAADALYERFDLEVLAPHEVILRLDELQRADEYRPRRSFVGPDGSVETVGLDRLAEVEALLTNHGPERRARLAELRELLARPAVSPVNCMRAEGRTVAAFSIVRAGAEKISVPFFVGAPDGVGPTAVRHLAEHFLRLAASERRFVVEVSPSNAVAEAALEAAGYLRLAERRWARIALAEVGRAEALGDRVATLATGHGGLGEIADRVRATIAGGGDVTHELERSLWPAKVVGSEVPCFVVPIEPKWAAELFDHDLAQQGLFGATAKLILNWENAYYRAAVPSVLEAPARVLWYVSADDKYQGAMSIRACSHIEEVVTADPKTAFRRFRRLGVYRWPDVLGIAKNDLNKPVQAFRFTGAECFPHPVGFYDARELLQAHGMGAQQFVSPVRIPEAAFFELYARAHGGDPRAA